MKQLFTSCHSTPPPHYIPTTRNYTTSSPSCVVHNPLCRVAGGLGHASCLSVALSVQLSTTTVTKKLQTGWPFFLFNNFKDCHASASLGPTHVTAGFATCTYSAQHKCSNYNVKIKFSKQHHVQWWMHGFKHIIVQHNYSGNYVIQAFTRTDKTKFKHFQAPHLLKALKISIFGSIFKEEWPPCLQRFGGATSSDDWNKFGTNIGNDSTF